MTTVDNPDNIVFDNGGANQFTLETTRVEEVNTKELKIIPGVVSKSNRSSGTKPTKVLDLLKIVKRFNVRGEIDKTLKPDLDALFEKGGPMNMLWESVTYTVSVEKFTYTKDIRDNSERQVVMTLVVGTDL